MPHISCRNCNEEFFTSPSEPYMKCPSCREKEKQKLKQEHLDHIQACNDVDIELEKREQERMARRLREERLRIALVIYRDICNFERIQLSGIDKSQDFASHACEAVEAADALLAALNPIQPILPHHDP